MRRWNWLLLSAACAVVGLAWASACAPGIAGTGSLRVLITDKPYPFDLISEAIVTIARVEVRAADATDEDEGDGQQEEPVEQPGEGEQAREGEPQNQNQAGENEFIIIADYPEGRPFNLLDLRNGKTDLLASAQVPAGTYDQMRLIVTGGSVALVDGTVFPLKVPSGEQTGIKLHFTFEVGQEQETVLLLDVDLSRAFSAIPAGHIDDVSTIRGFRFHPSIAMRLIELVEAGGIGGTVTGADGQPIAGASVTAYRDAEEVSTTGTADDGTYVLSGLPAGVYRVVFSATGYADAEVADVTVAAGQTTGEVNASLQPGP